MKSKTKYHNPVDPIHAALEQLESLSDAGIDPSLWVSADMSDRPGFELGGIAKKDLYVQALRNSVQQKAWAPTPSDPKNDLILGKSFDRHVEIGIKPDKPFRILNCGSSGAGKSNTIFNILAFLRKTKIKTLAWEYKPELRRIVPIWPDILVFTPRSAPWKFLHVTGSNKIAYFIAIISEIRHEFDLHPATVPLMWQVVERMLRGLKPNDPPFCWDDLQRVFEHEAEVQKRENLYTAARAIQNICVVLGRQAAARVVPDIPDEYNIVGYDFVGQDPAILRLFLGFEFIRLLFQAQEEGVIEDFRRVYVFDEGSVLFSSELMNRGVAHISSAKRFVSMCRFSGTGFIIGAQNLSQLDPFVTQNCDCLIVFRCTSLEDAKMAAQMLGLKPEATEELMRLPTGVAYVRSVEWERAVKIQTPLFQP